MIAPHKPDEQTSSQHTGTKSRKVWLLTVLAAVAVVGGVLVWTVNSGALDTSANRSNTTSSEAGSEGSSPAASDAPSATALPEPAKAPITSVVAKSSISSFLTAVTRVNTKSDDIGQQLSAVATGAIIDELANTQQELTANGWTQRGTAIVGAVTVTSHTPTTAVVQACVDSSSVVTLDSDGKPLAATGNQRALNIYSLQHDASGWRITSRTFPDNPNC